jgi:hypothetical protein
MEMEEVSGRLTPIAGGKNKRRRPNGAGDVERPTKIGKAELCDMVARAMIGHQGPFASSFPRAFRVLEPNPATRILLEVRGGDVVAVVPPRHVASVVVDWLAGERAPEFLATYRTAVEIVDYWAAIAPKLADDAIAQLRWPGEVGLTWHRLPWRCVSGVAPTWETVLARMSNAQAFCDWVGSLFDPASSLHQYVWVHGKGNDGKGAINRFLERVFGPSYRSKHPPRVGDKFWTYGLIGARVVVLPDCDNSDFVRSGFFKALTGGDPIDVEAKGAMSGTVRLGCKFLVFSNERPHVGTSTADQRRIIYCEFTAAGEYDASFERRLWDEGGGFLANCIAGYRARYPEHGEIKADKGEIEEIARGNEDEFQVAFDSFLLPAPKPEARERAWTAHDLRGVSVAPVDMQHHLGALFHDRKIRSDFVTWLAKKYGVKKAGFWARLDATSAAPTVVYRYSGCILKDPKSVEEYVNGERKASSVVNAVKFSSGNHR